MGAASLDVRLLRPGLLAARGGPQGAQMSCAPAIEEGFQDA
ncbi:hypothetical protein ACIHAR_23085 [Streptomyces sp. NPDC052016]